MYIKWLPERLPEPGTAAEWTAGGFLDIRKKLTPNNKSSRGVDYWGGGLYYSGGGISSFLNTEVNILT